MIKKITFTLVLVILIIAAIIFGVIPYYEKQQQIKRYDFTLDSIRGKFSLHDLKNKYAIVYFGYTFCPDICPTTLTMISQALHKLKKEDAKKFQLIFVSVDPDRDKLKILDEYAKYFYPNAIGVTTSNVKYLKKVTSSYGTFYAKEHEKGDTKDNYTVAHSSFVYIMGKDGMLLRKLPHLENYKSIYKVLSGLL